MPRVILPAAGLLLATAGDHRLGRLLILALLGLIVIAVITAGVMVLVGRSRSHSR